MTDNLVVICIDFMAAKIPLLIGGDWEFPNLRVIFGKKEPVIVSAGVAAALS